MIPIQPMRILLLMILFINFSRETHAQTATIANEKLNVAYADIPNPITIAVENYNSGQVILSTDNGTLVNKGNGKYDYTPLKEGEAIIKISTRTKGGSKEIGQTYYRIKALPLPNACIGWKHNDQINKAFLLSQMGVTAQFDNFDFDAVFKVSKFKITTMHNGINTFSKDITGNRFDTDVFKAFQALIAGDNLLVSDIYCIFPDKKERRLESIEFSIIP